MFSLARTLPSQASAEDNSSLFDWFIGTMVRSDSSRACMSDVRLCAFSDRPRSLSDRGAPEVSRFSCMLFLSVRRFSDYAGFNRPLACNAAGHIAFLHTVRESASCSATFRSSIARPTDTPVYASTNTSRCQPQDSGPRWIRSVPFILPWFFRSPYSRKSQSRLSQSRQREYRRPDEYP